MENTNEKTVAGNVLLIKEAKEALLQLEASQIRKDELPVADRYYLEINGANSSADVYINGKRLAHHDGGYSTFRADITDSMLPCFEVCDCDATALAHYDNGKIAAAVKNNDVYVHLPYLPEQLAELLLKKAGVHSWCDSGEPIIAGSDYMLIYCSKPGSRTVYLPDGKKHTIETNDYKTVIFDLETGELL